MDIKAKISVLRVILAGVLTLTIGAVSAGQTFQAAAEGMALTLTSSVDDVDDFSGLQIEDSDIPFTDTVDTTTASTEIDIDPTSILLDDCDSNQGEASVWYHYKPSVDTNLYIDTSNSDYDTLLAVWTADAGGNLSLVACNDDISLSPPIVLQSKVRLHLVANTTYYFEIIEWVQQAPTALAGYGGTLNFKIYEADPDVDVNIGGSLMGSYELPVNTNIRPSYVDENSGPIEVVSNNGLPIIASERVAYSPDGGTTWTSFDEEIGLPVNQLTDSYVFPWYNNQEMNTQIRFGNVGNTTTTVTVKIGGIVRGNYVLQPDQSMRKFYNLNAGPVEVSSSNGVPIIAGMRFARVVSTDPVDVPVFTEVMGLPANQLTDTYVFPWYNNLDMNTQIRFGNVGNQATTVTVKIGGVVRGNYVLQPDESVRKFYNLDSGPVEVKSSNGVPIIAGMRFAYLESTDPLVVGTFSEIMGMPKDNLSDDYWFPVYDNVTHNMQLRFGNMGSVATTVTVTIAGVEQGSYVVQPNKSARRFYTVNDGPVEVKSSNEVPIIAGMRFIYIESQTPLVVPVFTERLGLPDEQLSDSYIFTWYNNLELDTQLRIAAP